MEMFDLRADYKTLPDETLRRHFRRLIKRQRRFAAFTFALLIPAVIIYGMMGWANFLRRKVRCSHFLMQAQMPFLTMRRLPPAVLCSWRIQLN